MAEYDLISFESINLFWEPLESQYIVSFIFIRSERLKTRSITCKFYIYAHCIHVYARCIIFSVFRNLFGPKPRKLLITACVTFRVDQVTGCECDSRIFFSKCTSLIIDYFRQMWDKMKTSKKLEKKRQSWERQRCDRRI